MATECVTIPLLACACLICVLCSVQPPPDDDLPPLPPPDDDLPPPPPDDQVENPIASGPRRIGSRTLGADRVLTKVEKKAIARQKKQMVRL